MAFSHPSHPTVSEPQDDSRTSSSAAPTRWYHRTTIRGKTRISVAATLTGLLIILTLVLRAVVLESFLALEQQTMRTNVARATNTLTDRLHTLATLDESYATWDDTYAFVAHPQPAYIDANWYDASFTQAQINLVVIADATGRVVFSKAVDLQTGGAIPVPARFQHLTASDPLLAHVTATSTVTGVVLLAEHPMLVAAHAIVTSQGSGPARGTLMLGRFLDDQEVAQFAHQTQLDLTMVAADRTPQAVRQRRTPSGGTANDVVVQPLTDDTIAGYQVVPALDGGAGLLVQVHAPRDAYARGAAAIRYATVAFLVAGGVLGLVLLVVLDRLVLARLAQLADHLHVMGTQHDLVTRVPVTGHDELTHVGRAVNTMLDGLAQAQLAQQQAAAAQAQLHVHEETIRIQQMTLAELSTPLIPITEHVVVMPLIGAIDAQRAAGITEALLAGVAAHGARTVILDLTGVPHMDAVVATALIGCAHAVKLLGVEVIITGIRPDVAQALVSVGIAFPGIITRSTVHAGIAAALHHPDHARRSSSTVRAGAR